MTARLRSFPAETSALPAELHAPGGNPVVTGHVGKPGKVKGYNTLVPDYGRRSNGTP